jgi:hypothetical protein
MQWIQSMPGAVVVPRPMSVVNVHLRQHRITGIGIADTYHKNLLRYYIVILHGTIVVHSTVLGAMNQI